MTALNEIFAWLAEPVEQRETRYSKEATAYLLGVGEDVRTRIGPQRFDPVLEEPRAGKFGRRAAAAWTRPTAPTKATS